MNKSTRSCLSLSFIIGALAFVAVAGLALAVFTANRIRAIKAKEFEPPYVLISDPAGMTEFPNGDPINISVTADGQNPIARLELWADGALVDTKIGVDTKAGQPFYGNFEYTVKDGAQILIARAVDTAGIVGQSQPLGITGMPKGEQEQASFLVPVEEGDTLDTIAAKHGVTVGELEAANPALAGGAPAPGAMVQVPIKPKEKKPAQQQGQPPGQQPGQPPGQQPAQPPGQQPAQPPGQQPAQPPGQQPAQPPPQPPVQVKPAPLMAAELGKPLPLLVNDPVTGMVNSLQPILGGKAVPPAAPTDLQIGVSDSCQLFMTWQDNADNEYSYEVWMATPYMKSIAKLAAGPGKGTVWYSAEIPAYKKMVFWVIAVNQFGGSYSPLVALQNSPWCVTPPGTKEIATYYKFSLYYALVNGPYDRLYCYVSEGSNPETRIPNDDNTFVYMFNGKLLTYPKGKGDFITKIPPSGVMDLKGECLAWSGANLSKLGPFKTQYKLGTLTNLQPALSIKGDKGNYEIIFLATPLSSGDPKDVGSWWAFGYSDPALPKPYDLKISPSKEPGTETQKQYRRTVEWKWDGDNSKITGFAILLDHIPVKQVPAASRAAEIKIPAICDVHLRWEVAAVSDSGMALSAPFEQILDKCEYNLIVKFQSVKFDYVNDDEEKASSPPNDPCYQTAEGYFFLIVNGKSRSFYNLPNYIPLKGCQTYDLTALTKPFTYMYPNPTEFKIPWNNPADAVNMDIQATFWDYNGPNPTTRLADFVKYTPGGWTVQQFKNNYPNYLDCQNMSFQNTWFTYGKGTLNICYKLEEKAAGP